MWRDLQWIAIPDRNEREHVACRLDCTDIGVGPRALSLWFKPLSHNPPPPQPPLRSIQKTQSSVEQLAVVIATGADSQGRAGRSAGRSSQGDRYRCRWRGHRPPRWHTGRTGCSRAPRTHWDRGRSSLPPASLQEGSRVKSQDIHGSQDRYLSKTQGSSRQVNS